MRKSKLVDSTLSEVCVLLEINIVGNFGIGVELLESILRKELDVSQLTLIGHNGSKV